MATPHLTSTQGSVFDGLLSGPRSDTYLIITTCCWENVDSVLLFLFPPLSGVCMS